MPTEILQKVGTQIIFRDSADFLPTAANDLSKGSPTFVQFDLTSLADGDLRQSAKVDLGATRAAQYSVAVVIEWNTAPAAGLAVELYWAPSPEEVTATDGNPGGTSGSRRDRWGCRRW